MSPERLLGHPYSYASDIWGLGLSLLALAVGKAPFRGGGGGGGYWAVLQRVKEGPPLGLPEGVCVFDCVCLYMCGWGRRSIYHRPWAYTHPHNSPQNRHHQQQQASPGPPSFGTFWPGACTPTRPSAGAPRRCVLLLCFCVGTFRIRGRRDVSWLSIASIGLTIHPHQHI